MCVIERKIFFFFLHRMRQKICCIIPVAIILICFEKLKVFIIEKFKGNCNNISGLNMHIKLINV